MAGILCTRKCVASIGVFILVFAIVFVRAGAQGGTATNSAQAAGSSGAAATSPGAPSKSSIASKTHDATGVVKGLVRDAAGRPAADAMVFLEHATEVPGTEGTPTQATETLAVHSTGKGAYRFTGLAAGAYILRAQRTLSERTARTRIDVRRDETKTVNLEFLSAQATDAKTD
ncbi:MAG: carboxypeptidase-like regulatory domain-containing protein [Terriglobales bacterium]